MSNTRLHTFVPDQVIFEEGDQSHSMYLVQSGAVSIRKKKGHKMVELGKAATNEVIGELSFLDRKPRNATAVAVTQCQLLEIPFDSLDAEYAKVPDYIRKIISAVSERLRQADELIRNMKEGK